jgi:hypothetical protein
MKQKIASRLPSLNLDTGPVYHILMLLFLFLAFLVDKGAYLLQEDGPPLPDMSAPCFEWR